MSLTSIDRRMLKANGLSRQTPSRQIVSFPDSKNSPWTSASWSDFFQRLGSVLTGGQSGGRGRTLGELAKEIPVVDDEPVDIETDGEEEVVSVDGGEAIKNDFTNMLPRDDVPRPLLQEERHPEPAQGAEAEFEVVRLVVGLRRAVDGVKDRHVPAGLVLLGEMLLQPNEWH